MDIIKFLKKELAGWHKYEIAAIFIVFIIVLINGIVLHDNKAAIVSAICGVLYTTLAGKGKISCYFFGLLGTSFYSYLSLKNALWGNLILYACYYFPMQVTGIFKWKGHLKSDTGEIYKAKLSKKEFETVKAAAQKLIKVIKKEKLVLDWRKKQSTRAKVKEAIETICDETLPEIYDKELFQEKCNALYEHFYDYYNNAQDNIYNVA